MIFKLRSKLTLAFIFIATLLIVFTGVFGKWMLEDNFKNYVIQKQEKSNNDIVNLVSEQYMGDNLWNADVVENIGIRALEQGQIVKVNDISGKIVWDATMHNNGMCEQMLQHMSDNMSSKYPSFNGKYTVSSYPLISNSTKIGMVEIGYYGPFYFDDEDLTFINALNTALLWVTLFGLVISILLGRIFAKRISDPIDRVIITAKLIAKGDYTQKSNEKTTTKEIIELVGAINNLSSTLQEQEELRKRLTSDVAHELRTPLATLQSHLEAMIDGIWEPTSDRLKGCHEEIVRLSKMVGEIQLLTKYEGEVKNIDMTEFDLGDLALNVAMDFENQFKNKCVKISVNGRGSIIADCDKLRQVIINLLSNALKYTNDGGKVEVVIEDKENSIIIKVKDNGCGISKEDLPYIFERFYRADKSRNRLTGGAGIGLAIVKAIITAHNGSLQVESVVNIGTTFTISLPKNNFK